MARSAIGKRLFWGDCGCSSPSCSLVGLLGQWGMTTGPRGVVRLHGLHRQWGDHGRRRMLLPRSLVMRGGAQGRLFARPGPIRNRIPASKPQQRLPAAQSGLRPNRASRERPLWLKAGEIAALTDRVSPAPGAVSGPKLGLSLHRRNSMVGRSWPRWRGGPDHGWGGGSFWEPPFCRFPPTQSTTCRASSR